MVKSFTDYYKFREDSALDVGRSTVGKSNLSNVEEEGISSLFNLAQMSWSRYRSQTEEFFQRLANQDDDIKNELDKLLSGRSTTSRASKKIDQDDRGDEVVPPEADISPGDGDGDGDLG